LGSYRCLPCLPGSRRILRAAVLIVGLAIVVFVPQSTAQSQAPHPQTSNPAVQTITPSDLTKIVNLDGPWRFHAGDDPHFADPALDDSSWPSIRPNQPFRTVGVPEVTGSYVWARIHLRIPQAVGPLALAVYCPRNDQYEIFANGSRIGASRGMATRTVRHGSSFPVALPQSGDIVLAIRFYWPWAKGSGFPMLPFTRLSLGSSDAVRTATDLELLRAFNNGPLAAYTCLCISLLIGITVMILYRSQRGHDEYLWLGIMCLDFVLFAFIDNAIASGWLPLTLPVILLELYTGWGCIALHVEFVMRFTRIRRRWPIRVLQALILIGPALYVSPTTSGLYAWTLIFVWVALAAVDIACFVSAYRRGMADAGLFLVPCLACVVLDLAWVAALSFPAAVPWGLDFHFGPVAIAGNYLASISFNLGIVAVVLYRFVRVARDEAHAAAELEAARAIQRVLIPAHPASAPGISIDAAFLPSREVGGDFYRCRALPDGSQWVLIGDVSGKGTAAGITGAMLLGAAEGHESDPPARQLSRLNQVLCNSGVGGLATCLVLHISPDAVVVAANAGHLAPYRNGEEMELGSALPLGVTAEATYSETRFELDGGDRLTLVTDGVVEARNPSGELFGFIRTRDVSGLSAGKIADAAQAFGQDDDITVLTLSYTPVLVAQS
jgi:Stage II sporulation protein E (SpoIIE)